MYRSQVLVESGNHDAPIGLNRGEASSMAYVQVKTIADVQPIAPKKGYLNELGDVAVRRRPPRESVIVCQRIHTAYAGLITISRAMNKG